MRIYNHLWNFGSESSFYYDVVSRLDLKVAHDIVLITKLYPYNGNNLPDPWIDLKPKLIQNNKPVIIFLCGDEYYSGGEEYIIDGITTLIFKQYTSFSYVNHPKFRPIPLSLINAQRDFSLTIPINQRIYDYSFMGIVNPGRQALQEQLLLRCNDKWIKTINFYNDWQDISNQTYFWNRYLQILQSSKLAFCPAGWRSNESFRMIEAAKSGCIIAATELIPHWYNINSPYIKIDSWNDISIIDEILSRSEKELQQLSNATIDWYNECLSSKAIARYVNQEVNNIF